MNPNSDETRTLRPRTYVAYALMVIGASSSAAVILRTLSDRTTLFAPDTNSAALSIGAFLAVGLAGAIAPLVLRRRFFERLHALAGRLSRRPPLMEAILILGLFLVVGALFAARFLSGGAFTRWSLVGGLIMLFTGLTVLFTSSMNRERAVSLGGNLFLSLGGIAFAAFMAELGLRIIMPLPFNAFMVLPPSLHREHNPGPEVMPGIDGVSIYSTQANGIRGDAYDPENYNILAVGGSTTEALYLDDSEAWPYLLQEILGQTAEGQPVWVGNVGYHGLSSAAHVYALRYVAPQYEIDMAVVMVGANDALLLLRKPESNLPDPDDPGIHDDLLASAFYATPLSTRDFPSNLALWNVAYEGLRWLRQRNPGVDLIVEDPEGLNYVRRREQFQNATPVIDELPDLSTGLDQYERNLVALIDEAEAQDIRLVLTTQPMVWSASTSDEMESLLWMGVTGDFRNPTGRYTIEVLAEALGQFNERLLEVCADHDIECVDVAGAVSGNETLFYDDMHFNEVGSQAVAESLADYLESQRPFTGE